MQFDKGLLLLLLCQPPLGQGGHIYSDPLQRLTAAKLLHCSEIATNYQPLSEDSL